MRRHRASYGSVSSNGDSSGESGSQEEMLGVHVNQDVAVNAAVVKEDRGIFGVPSLTFWRWLTLVLLALTYFGVVVARVSGVLCVYSVEGRLWVGWCVCTPC